MTAAARGSGIAPLITVRNLLAIISYLQLYNALVHVDPLPQLFRTKFREYDYIVANKRKVLRDEELLHTFNNHSLQHPYYYLLLMHNFRQIY